MMVVVNEWSGDARTEDLAEVLRPKPLAYEFEGSFEEAIGVGEKTAVAFGKLAALLVERGIISLEDAANVSGVYESLSRVC